MIRQGTAVLDLKVSPAKAPASHVRLHRSAGCSHDCAPMPMAVRNPAPRHTSLERLFVNAARQESFDQGPCDDSLWTAKNGERGSKAKLEYKATIADLRATLADLQAQRAKWDHRVTLMRSESVDRDLAEEQARNKLDYVDSRDVEIFTGSVKH